MGARTSFLMLGFVLACSPVTQDLGNNDPNASDGGGSDETVDGGAGSNVLDGSTRADVNPLGPEWVDQGSLGAVSTANAIHGTRADDLWIVGRSPDLTRPGRSVRVHYDGSHWNDLSQVAAGGLNSVWSFGDADAWAVGDDGRVQRWNGSAWLGAPVVPTTTDDLEGVWGTSASDVWVVGGKLGGSSTAEIFHFDGQAWSSRSGLHDQFTCVFGFGTKDVWVGGFKTILRYDGMTWTTSVDDLQTTVNALWGTSSTDLWAVGNFGFVSHWDGAKWTPSAMGEPIAFESVWGFATNDIYAVGSEGTIAHYDGTRWTKQKLMDAGTLEAVWGASARDVWVTGNGHTFRRQR